MKCCNEKSCYAVKNQIKLYCTYYLTLGYTFLVLYMGQMKCYVIFSNTMRSKVLF